MNRYGMRLGAARFVAGETLGDHLRRTIFAPLGMMRTRFEIDSSIQRDVAVGYEVGGKTGTAEVGRLVLGVAAGWYAREFDAVGVPFKQRGRQFERNLDRPLRDAMTSERLVTERVDPGTYRERHPIALKEGKKTLVLFVLLRSVVLPAKALVMNSLVRAGIWPWLRGLDMPRRPIADAVLAVAEAQRRDPASIGRRRPAWRAARSGVGFPAG